MDTLLPDFKYGFRVLRKSPGFVAVAALVLGLGIGANTAMFSVVNAVLLRPLPFRDPDRLVNVWHVPPAKSFPGMTRFAVSAANYVDWKERNRVFEHLAIYSVRSFNVTGTDRPETVNAAAVSSEFFSTLGVAPMKGRTFTEQEDQEGHGNVVILSHSYWQNHLGSDPQAVGRELILNGNKYTVVGVMDGRFHFPTWADMWTPNAWNAETRAVRGEHHFSVVGRLRSGTTLKQAQAEMNAISANLEQQYPEDDKGWGAVVVSLRDDMVEDVHRSLIVLLGAVAFVLLIACANVANLVLARNLGRQKEIAIRSSLGASRTRLVQQFLAESVLLALAGGILGLLLAHFGIQLITAFLGDKLPRFVEIELNGQVLMFALGISIATGIIAGLVPALRSSRSNLNDALKQGVSRTDADSGGTRTRSALVISEVALSLMLLVAAGLMIRSLWMLREVDPGFDSHNLLTMTVRAAGPQFEQVDRLTNYFDDTLQQVRHLPDVDSASAVDDLPLSNDGSSQPIVIEGSVAGPLSEQPEVAVRMISPAYFHTMHIPIIRGRDFSDSDKRTQPAVIVISETMARRFWPNQDPIGKHLTISFSPTVTREVVGVVGDVKLFGLNQAESNATLYAPMAQFVSPTMSSGRSLSMSLVVRTKTSPANTASAITDAIHQVNSAQPISDVITMDDLLYDSISSQRFNMLLLAVFAGLALVLAGVGIYSVLAYGVRRRAREIGIRMALGAQVKDVVRTVLIDGLKPTAVGLALGLVGALVLGRVMANLVFGVETSDPITIAAVSLLLGAVAVVASIFPTYRATQVDPMIALRDE